MTYVAVRYGQRELSIRVPTELLAYELRPSDAPESAELDAEVEAALAEPVESARLREIVRPRSRVALLVDDITRPTPTKRILPHVLEELKRGGVATENIQLVIALGTHRPMASEEMVEKYGSEILAQLEIVSHDCLDTDNLVSFGTTRRGTEIWVNRVVAEADIKVGIGNIVPHHPTGWSGGAKILLPGVAGQKTTAQFHLLGADEQHLGSVETPCREEMEDFAQALGFDFIINTVLDRSGNLVKAVAGHIVAAHRVGVRFASQVFGVPFERFSDVTLSSTYPIDFDLFQADKGLFSAALSTVPGGEIVLLSPCYEGISATHGEAAELAGRDDGTLRAMAHNTESHVDPLSVAEVLYLNSLRRTFNITLACERVPKEVVERFGFRYIRPDDLQAYVDEKVRTGHTIGIIHNSTETLPLQRNISR